MIKSHNLPPRIGVILVLSADKNESVPDVGFGARTIRFLADIDAFINMEYQLSERIWPGDMQCSASCWTTASD